MNRRVGGNLIQISEENNTSESLAPELIRINELIKTARSAVS